MDFPAAEEAQPSQPIHQILSLPILLADRIHHAVTATKSPNLVPSDLVQQLDRLTHIVRSLIRLTNNGQPLYDRPIRRIFSNVIKTLHRTLTLLLRRRHRHRRLFHPAADFGKLSTLLEAAIADTNWLLSIFDSNAEHDVVLSLPPIASNDPILAWVWSFISSLYSSPLNLKIEVANELSSLANDNDRNKKMIVEEEGVPPLSNLLNDSSSSSSPEAKIAASTTLFNLANDQHRCRTIASKMGLSIIVQSFSNSNSIGVRVAIAKLIARMAEFDRFSQEGFGRENAIRPLVTSLSYEINVRDRENLIELKTSCARALWMLTRSNPVNCRILTEMKGLVCLAKLIETETDELHANCLMTVMEITSAAESNPGFRRASFKTNSPAAKAIVYQLLRLVDGTDGPEARLVPAIRSIGSLARTFPARETRVIRHLIKQLSHESHYVATEAVVALRKFVCPENFLCNEHSKTVVEFDGVGRLTRLLAGNERMKYEALIVLCYVSISKAGKSDVVEEARVLRALEVAEKGIVGKDLELKELVIKAMDHLSMYHHQRQSCSI